MDKLVSRAKTLALGVIAVATAIIAWHQCRSHAVPSFATPYQAVVLMNGQVFFGRLEDLGSAYPTLRDVFYVQTRQNPDTKATSNVLIKRGGEAHGPDRMVLNRQQIQLIEPIKEDSQIGKLIAEQNRAK